MPTMEERVAARYASSRREAGSGYGSHFVKIVQMVDALTDAKKKMSGARSALEQLKNLGKHDADVKDERGDRLYGLEQQVGYMGKEMDAVEKAISHMESAYDTANDWFLERGLK